MSDESSTVQTFENPPEPYFKWYGVLLFIFLSIFSILMYLVVPNPIILIYGLFGSLLGPVLIIWMDYVSRPTRVDIDAKGIGFHYRLYQPRTETWEGIAWIYVSPNKYTTVTGKDKRRGVIQLKKVKLTTHVTYEIGLAMRSAYQRYHGPLPELPDDWKNRPY